MSATPIPAGLASYQYTLCDKLLGLAEAIRPRLFPRSVLVAGPFTGEFGHELMEWQAVIRARIPHYREVHVITYPGRDYLYPNCRVHYHDVPLEAAGYRYGRYTPQQTAQQARSLARNLGLCDYDVLTPRQTCTQYHRRWIWQERFVPMAEPPVGGWVRDLAFHFRWVNKEGPDKSRNYPLALADELTALCLRAGHRVCCIGHPRYSYCPDGVEDLRAEDLKASVAAICSARLLVGELSGPMHLAQLCRQPILIWADGQWRIDGANRWNVFQAPVFVVANDTFRPSPQRVAQSIEGALRQARVLSR